MELKWVGRRSLRPAVTPTPPRNGAEVRAARRGDLETLLHALYMNEGILVAPFHTMFLMCPATTAADVDHHTHRRRARCRARHQSQGSDLADPGRYSPHETAGLGSRARTSSVSAHVAMGGGAHYSAAKAGVNAFIRGAALELARTGITVNGVEPGFIAKPGRGKLGTPDAIAALSTHIPLGRMGDLDDIAYAMQFLASEEARYITGHLITVDGGSTLPETGYAVDALSGTQP